MEQWVQLTLPLLAVEHLVPTLVALWLAESYSPVEQSFQAAEEEQHFLLNRLFLVHMLELERLVPTLVVLWLAENHSPSEHSFQAE